MKIAGIIKNDFTAFGVCVTLFMQGCPIRCSGCHNPGTWSFTAGIEKNSSSLISELEDLLTKNNIHRDLCIQGGEPLCEQNAYYTYFIISEIKKSLPNTKIYVWSGYTYEELLSNRNIYIQKVLKNSDVLIAGPYVEAERDVTLPLRGSRNQEIIYLTKSK